MRILHRVQRVQGKRKGVTMADRHDYTRELCIKYDETVKELRKIAEKRNIDLSMIRISNKEAEKFRRTYMFYN